MAKALIVEILADTKQFSAELDKAAGRTRQFSKAAGVAGLAIAGGLAYGLEKSVQAASAMQTTTAKVDQAFKAAGVSSKQYASQIDKAESAGRKLGFSNIDVRESIGNLVTATQDGGKAIKDMSVAEDLARYKHIQLADATKIITSAMAGSTRAARQLGISVAAVHDSAQAAAAAYSEQKKKIDAMFPSTSKMTEAQKKQKDALLANAAAQYTKIKADAQLKDKQATSAQVIATVTQRVHGQSEAYAKTAAGGMAQFHAQMEALQENLGQALIPALEKVTEWLATATGYLAQHTTTAKILIGVVATLAAGLMAFSVAQKIAAAATAAMTAAEWLFNAALDANPIGIVIVAVAALGVAAYELVKHWGAVSSFFIGLWGDIKAVFFTAIDWIGGHWKLFLGYPGLIWQYWPQISKFFSGLWGGIKGAFGGAINWIKGEMIGFVNFLIDKLNWLIDSYNQVAGWITGNINKVGKIGSGPTHGPAGPGGPAGVPHHAAGGIFTRPHIAMIAERGPEAVVPLRGGMVPGGSPLRGLLGGGSVHVSVGPVNGTADAGFARVLAGELATQLRGGRIPALQQAIQAV
jgi:hypothetical protein